MTKPLFTILTATFNVGSAIDIAAESVRDQHRSDVEYIVIDGASSDDTLVHVARNGDVITKVISEPDKGIYDALNKGIAAASGELIGIIGADDSLLSGGLDAVAEAHRTSPADIYAGQTLLTYPDGRGRLRLDEEYGVAALASGIPFGHNAMFAKRSAYERVGLYDLSYRICADANWVHRAIKSGLSCTRISQALVQFNPSGVSSLDNHGILNETYRTIIANFPMLSNVEARTLLYGIRGWENPLELVPLLDRWRENSSLLESVRLGFNNRAEVWQEIEDRLVSLDGAQDAWVAKAEGAPEPRPRCKNPVFSFIVPAFNVESLIGRCLESIVNQPFPELEVIVVDDGSTDETAAVIENYCARDQRVQLIRQANTGQGGARAAAMGRARGLYVWCVDADDRIQEQSLDRISTMFAATEADVIVLNFAYEDEDGEVSYSTLVPSYLAGRTVDPLGDERTFAAVSAWTCPPWRYVIRNDLLHSHSIGFSRGLFYEDHPFSIDLITSARRVHVDSAISYYYLQRHGSTVRSLDSRAFDFIKIRRLVLDRLKKKQLISRFPDIVTSYVFPINFIKAHVASGHQQEFLAEIERDTRPDELDAVRAFGRSGELALLRASETGTIHNVDLTTIRGSADRAGELLELSRTLTEGDVYPLSWIEGPYPQFGIDKRFQWIDGLCLDVRLRVRELTRPILRLRYRNAQPEQFITVEQNNCLIEMYPCRETSVGTVGQIDIPVRKIADVVTATIRMRKADGSSGRVLALAIDEIDLLDGAAATDTSKPDQAASAEPVVAGIGSSIEHLRLDVRRDIQPRTYLRVGKFSDVGGTFVFERGTGTITIGDRTSIGGGSLLICTQEDGIQIGSNVMVSWNVTIMDNDAHSLDPAVRANDAYDWLAGERTGRRGHYKDWTNVRAGRIVIRDEAWIGFGSTILKGVTIGRGAVVGCNSVVTKDVPDYGIVAGNPARLVGATPGRRPDGAGLITDAAVPELRV